MTSPIHITICADDYGLAPGVSQAIRDLIAQGRLHATGCMTGSPHWPEAARALKAMEHTAEIGLHVTLTGQKPLTAMPDLAPGGVLPGPDQVVIRSWLGRLDRAEIAAEVNAQVDSFVNAYGTMPDFIDGHHHVHLLPVIRDVVLDVWKTRLGGKGWIRSCWRSPLDLMRRGVDPVRASIIALLGLRWQGMLRDHGVPHNRAFIGIYDLTDRIAFSRLMAGFLDRVTAGTLVMVHPGLVDDALRAADSLTAQREVELAYLASSDFGAMLQERGVILGPLALS